MENAVRHDQLKDTETLCRPYDDAVGDTSRMFRAILTALSHPGRIVSAFGPGEYPELLGSTAFGAALTLFDSDTQIYLSPRLRGRGSEDNLRFHCGCPITDDATAATFALMKAEEAETLLPRLSGGTPDYPDASATALIIVDGFTNEDSVRLTGPGIYKYKSLGMRVPRAIWTVLKDNHERYPLGFDSVFIGNGEIIGLPRSTAIDPAITVEEV